MSVEIEAGIELPEEAKKEKKPRKSRGRKPKVKEGNSVAQLIEALKFASVIQKKAGSVEQQFCALINNWLVANNGIITVATKIEEDLAACPHTYQLLDALNKTGTDINITQLNANVLSVKSEKFKALIPCCNFEELSLPAPDAKIIDVDNRLKLALDAVAALATEGAETAHLAAVLLQSGSTVATNNSAILEYWHGFQLPGEYLIPKAAAIAVVKCEKDLIGLGFGESSVTFHFSDESIIKTQLFAERYPNYRQWLDVEANPCELPEDFFKAVKAVESFSKNGIVYFDENVVSSRESENEATTYQIEGLPNGMAFNAKFLSLVEHAMQKVDFDKSNNRAIFFGENIRGMVLGVNVTEAYKLENNSEEEVAF